MVAWLFVVVLVCVYKNFDENGMVYRRIVYYSWSVRRVKILSDTPQDLLKKRKSFGVSEFGF